MATEAGEKKEPMNKKKKLIILGSGLVAVVVALLVMFIGLGGDELEEEASEKPAANQTVNDTGSAYYVALPRDFIFNVPGTQRDRVVQITVQLLVRGSRNEELARQNIPLIEGALLQVFSTGTAETLSSPEGKREIRVQARGAVREALREATNGSPVVEEVLFTGFVMQ